MTRKTLTILAAGGSLALLLGAFGFQMMGYAPCKMCIWQRWPHAVAIVIGVVAFFVPRAGLLYLGALAALTTAAIGVFHAGVELKWWEGPTTCTSGDISNLSTDELMTQILNAPVIRCDEIAWQFMGISMAGWNAILSICLVGLWIAAARRS
ncbi:MAG: disulfide bond formation protein B [Marinosulfonomonas sp.]